MGYEFDVGKRYDLLRKEFKAAEEEALKKIRSALEELTKEKEAILKAEVKEQLQDFVEEKGTPFEISKVFLERVGNLKYAIRVGKEIEEECVAAFTKQRVQ